MSDCRLASCSKCLTSGRVPFCPNGASSNLHDTIKTLSGAFPLSDRQCLSQWQWETETMFHRVIWHFAVLCSLALLWNRENLPQAGARTKLPGISVSCFFFFTLCYSIKRLFLICMANKESRYTCNKPVKAADSLRLFLFGWHGVLNWVAVFLCLSQQTATLSQVIMQVEPHIFKPLIRAKACGVNRAELCIFERQRKR